ncbi:hypothetical protein [Saccharopolyspora thermophila]|uniref:hypothetical protein n=1 Tax=Saccharopolyspora thermophila TaxID=89367 RepID=UPI001E5F639A|nr:hypothetical protein [Saccharopolyspora subtropica]
MNKTVESVLRQPVSDIDCPAEAFGHGRLATTVAEFCERWDEGVSNLADDGAEIAARLAQCVEVYRRTDEAVHAHFNGIVQRATGEDPAAQ